MQFALAPPYPNPFGGGSSAHARLRFSMARLGPARVVVYDLLGRVVECVFEGEAEAGQVYRVDLHGGTWPRGSTPWC